MNTDNNGMSSLVLVWLLFAIVEDRKDCEK